MTQLNNDALRIDYDPDMDRFYIPINSRYEIQTKGKGSSFRICNTESHLRLLVTDEYIHPMLEDMAKATNAELNQLIAAKADSERQTGEMIRAISLAADAREAALEREIVELKARALEESNKYIAYCDLAEAKIIELQAHINVLREALDRLREDRKLWKVSGIGGQDSYAGLPPAMRIIDEALSAYENLSEVKHDTK